MSASEKLKALEGAMKPLALTGATSFGEEMDHHAASEKAESFLVEALPQIVAVVEAAERAERKAMVHGGNGTLVDIARSLHPALSALDEALS